MTATKVEKAALEAIARGLAVPVCCAIHAEAPELRLADRSTNVVDRGGAMEVPDRAGRCGHGDAVMESRRRFTKRGRPVQPDSASRSAPSGGANRYSHRPEPGREPPPDLCA